MKTRSQTLPAPKRRATNNASSGSPPRATKRNKPSSSAQAVQKVFLSNGIIPKWTTLPYLILMTIFQFAAYPLINSKTNQRTPGTAFLLNAALVCKAFLEPALAALYYAPPLYPLLQIKKLAATLALDPKTTAIKYRTKVRYLDMDPGDPIMGANLTELLLQYTPQLLGLGAHDLVLARYGGYPPFSSGRSYFRRPTYFQELFKCLRVYGLSLRSWNWNFTLTKNGSHFPWNHFVQIHRELLMRLETTTLTYYDGTPGEDDLTSAICALPMLKNLSIIFATDLSATFWSALPNALKSLALSYTEVEAGQLLDYLVANGSNLRELILRQNDELTLSFSVRLASACPRLVTFYMDAHSLIGHYWSTPNDSPLLLEDEIPTWPPTLQTLTLENITGLESELAQTLFQSILDASFSLKDLRKLVIKAGVNIPHRERAEFRQKWVDKLQLAFMRQCADPDPNLYSLKAYEASKTSLRGSTEDAGATGSTTAGPKKSTRSSRSDRLLRGSVAQTPAAPATSENGVVVQGMCDVVDVRIDNIRPTDQQFNEGDFLDSEASGDDDWNEDNSGWEDEGHAW